MTGIQAPRRAGTILAPALAMTLALAAVSTVSSWAEVAADEMNGRLVQQGGNMGLAAPDALSGKTIIALYYSTYGPVCRKFSPKLLRFYHAAIARFPNFQLVMVCRYAPSFPSEKKMSDYILKEKLDWPILTFGDAENVPLVQKLAANSTPYLVIIDAEGDKLMETEPGEDASAQALERLQKLLENSSRPPAPEVPAPNAPAGEPVRPAPATPPAAEPAAPIHPGDYYLDSQGTEYMPGYQPPGAKLMHRTAGRD